jgi:hypothetical protein
MFIQKHVYSCILCKNIQLGKKTYPKIEIIKDILFVSFHVLIVTDLQMIEIKQSKDYDLMHDARQFEAVRHTSYLYKTLYNEYCLYCNS